MVRGRHFRARLLGHVERPARPENPAAVGLLRRARVPGVRPLRGRRGRSRRTGAGRRIHRVAGRHGRAGIHVLAREFRRERRPLLPAVEGRPVAVLQQVSRIRAALAGAVEAHQEGVPGLGLARGLRQFQRHPVVGRRLETSVRRGRVLR